MQPITQLMNATAEQNITITRIELAVSYEYTENSLKCVDK